MTHYVLRFDLRVTESTVFMLGVGVSSTYIVSFAPVIHVHPFYTL